MADSMSVVYSRGEISPSVILRVVFSSENPEANQDVQSFEQEFVGGGASIRKTSEYLEGSKVAVWYIQNVQPLAFEKVAEAFPVLLSLPGTPIRRVDLLPPWHITKGKVLMFVAGSFAAGILLSAMMTKKR